MPVAKAPVGSFLHPRRLPDIWSKLPNWLQEDQKGKMLEQTQLSRVQLDNWFINTRKRWWYKVRVGAAT